MAIDDFYAAPPEKVEVIDNSNEAVAAFNKKFDSYGNTKVELTPSHLRALQNGKCIAVYDGEFSTIITAQIPES
jgi:glutathionyl-hydroquinone reductase